MHDYKERAKRGIIGGGGEERKRETKIGREKEGVKSLQDEQGR